MRIDLNCDMGESWYDRQVGQDRAIMPLISSCNLACGFHGGDALSLQRTIGWALAANVAIGAHPSYPDRKYFGRRELSLPLENLSALLQYQIAALQGMVIQQGGQLQHLKAHGALYHRAASDPELANTLAQLARDFSIPILFGPPHSALASAAKEQGLDFAAEGFIDRTYEADLRLRSRQLAGAILEDPSQAAAQALQLAADGQIRDNHGQLHDLVVQTLCVHGDHPQSLAILRAVRNSLDQAGISVQAPGIS